MLLHSTGQILSSSQRHRDGTKETSVKVAQGTCWHQRQVGHLVTEAVFPGSFATTVHWVGIFLLETVMRYK